MELPILNQSQLTKDDNDSYYLESFSKKTFVSSFVSGRMI